MRSTDVVFKILHMSDLHLGKSLRAQDLAEDQAYVLGQIVRRAEGLAPDLVIISGDVFDRSIPSEGAQTMFGRFMADLRRVLPRHARILVIPGNHDSPRRITFAAELFEAVGIHLVSDVRLAPALVLEKGGTRAAVWALPFVTHGAYHEFRKSLVENRNEKEMASIPSLGGDGSMAERVASVVTNLRPFFGEYALNILAAHCYVRGAALSESDTAFIGGTEVVPASLFDGFDYVALGHLHACRRSHRRCGMQARPWRCRSGMDATRKAFCTPNFALRRLRGSSRSYSNLCARLGACAEASLS
jgi:exonuclease SbcD